MSSQQAPTMAAKPAQAVKKSLAAKHALPTLDQHTVEKLKEQALAKAKQFKQQLNSSAREGLEQARLTAVDVASSKSAKEAGGKLWRLVHAFTDSRGMKALSRLLICCYFLNTVWDTFGRWRMMQQPDIKLRAQRWPEQYGLQGFPWFSMCVLLPCALLTAAGVQVLVGGSVLAAYEVYDSLHLMRTQLTMMMLYGIKPNELVVKRLAIMGCTALVLAHSIRESRVVNSYAGLLVTDDKKEPSRLRSLVLLLGRLLMTSLFVYVGVVQLQRVVARDFVLVARIPHSQLWARDGHDNNWLLLEFLFSLPFSVGWHTAAFARLLSLTLALEAVTCWPFWATWPSWSYAAHVRLHFVTNLAVAGGLLLLAGFGAGRYTMDNLIKAKKKE